MLSMGLTLSIEDFSRVIKLPKSIFLGVSLQYLLMPGLGYALALAFELPIDFVIGLVLVACCPGGTASNVVCFIAKTHVALSVSLTTCSTILAVFLTPLLTTWWVESISLELTGLKVDVDTMELFLKTLKVVILPVLIGVFLNHYFNHGVKKVEAIYAFSCRAFYRIHCRFHSSGEKRCHSGNRFRINMRSGLASSCGIFIGIYFIAPAPFYREGRSNRFH